MPRPGLLAVVLNAARSKGLATSSAAMAALVSMLALPCWAQTTPKLVPILEPGKPMRFEAVAPPTTGEPPVADPCDLASPQDRRTTTSVSCLRCHDGSKAANARSGHRFDIEYVTYGKDLRPEPEKYNPAVVLANGMVTCLSCHEPLSSAAFRLAAPTGGTLEKRLCAACHIR